MSGALDLKLRLVSITPMAKRIQLYGIAGGTYNRFHDILENNRGQLSIGDVMMDPSGQFLTTDHSWHSGWGYNAGAGFEIGAGRTNLFVESRFARFKGENSNISHIPLVLGLSFY